MNNRDDGHSDDESAPGTNRCDLPGRSLRPRMRRFVKDAANLVTLAGLFCGGGSIYFAIRGIFPAAMIAMLWAVLFDWFDGSIARRTRGRTDEFRAFGGQLEPAVNSQIFGALIEHISSSKCSCKKFAHDDFSGLCFDFVVAIRF